MRNELEGGCYNILLYKGCLVFYSIQYLHSIVTFLFLYIHHCYQIVKTWLWMQIRKSDSGMNIAFDRTYIIFIYEISKSVFNRKPVCKSVFGSDHYNSFNFNQSIRNRLSSQFH